MYTKVSKKKSYTSKAAATRESTERQLAQCAGTEAFYRRDPLFHVSETFRTNFDKIGQKHAKRLEEESGTDSSLDSARAESISQRGQNGQERTSGSQPGASYDANFASPLYTFTNMAFQRGGLSAAVLAGTGKMMLVSCLKRTVGQNAPQRLQERTLFGIGSQMRNLPGHDPDQMAFNRTFSKSAIGLVVDTLRDARRVVDSMADMADGAGELGLKESETLRRMYPFLDSSGERRLLEEYKEKIKLTSDMEERAVLQNAMLHTRALMDKKAQMKNEFINKLRLISDRATEALAELETPGTQEEIIEMVLDETNSIPDGADGAGEGLPENPDDLDGLDELDELDGFDGLEDDGDAIGGMNQEEALGPGEAQAPGQPAGQPEPGQQAGPPGGAQQ